MGHGSHRSWNHILKTTALWDTPGVEGQVQSSPEGVAGKQIQKGLPWDFICLPLCPKYYQNEGQCLLFLYTRSTQVDFQVIWALWHGVLSSHLQHWYPMGVLLWNLAAPFPVQLCPGNLEGGAGWASVGAPAPAQEIYSELYVPSAWPTPGCCGHWGSLSLSLSNKWINA